MEKIRERSCKVGKMYREELKWTKRRLDVCWREWRGGAALAERDQTEPC